MTSTTLATTTASASLTAPAAESFDDIEQQRVDAARADETRLATIKTMCEQFRDPLHPDNFDLR